MAKKIETFGTCKSGLPEIIHRKEFYISFANTFKEGERIKLTIEKLYKKRSNQQNRFYWGIILEVLLCEIKEQGNDYTKEQLHEELINRFAPKKEMKNKNGEFYEVPKRTSEMTTSEFCDYSNDVCKWSVEFWCCSIPEPNTQTEIF